MSKNNLNIAIKTLILLACLMLSCTDAMSQYKDLTSRDSVKMEGLMNVIQKGDSVFLEMPVGLMGKPFLVHNKLQRVTSELNEASANKGVNYESQMVAFEWDKKHNKVIIRQKRVEPEFPKNSAISRSVVDNYIDPIISSLKVRAAAPDSTTVIFNVSDLFNGKKNILNDVFNEINIGTQPDADLSRIVSVKSFERSVVARSELTTVVHEGSSKVNVTVEVSTAIFLLPENPMNSRKQDWRVGYFTVPSLYYDDYQQRAERTGYITRWRLEPSDTIAYMHGELVEPKKPIVFYIDKATPEYLRPYIIKGITDWNRAFELAGFKNSVQAYVVPDTLDVFSDDLSYSVLTYAASEKKNAMGPSTIDPRTGEILEADIIWWHNVLELLREWLIVQTAPTDPRARSFHHLPQDMIGDAVRFVACHEAGHSLGLRHNMMASAAYPTDSLRSASFIERMGGTSASIMDYARFNYVAQPEDGVQQVAPSIGPYDLMAIEWGYRWFPRNETSDIKGEKETLSKLLSKYQGKEYRFSEQQPQRSAIDPRALSEDLGDDPVKSASYGIANLKRIMPHLIDWTRTGDMEQSYDDAAELYSYVLGQWQLYLYHVMANIGGIYIERPMITGSKSNAVKTAYEFVDEKRQRESVQFLIDEVLTFPQWLFGNKFASQIFLQRSTPSGVVEQEPVLILKNVQNYVLWDMMTNDRLVRMYENEWMNGDKAFTAVEMIDMLHQNIFRKTTAGQRLDIMERHIQKSFVDALITAAAEQEGVKLRKGDNGERSVSGTGYRTVDMSTNQINRVSDAISVKRGEMIRILKLLKAKRTTGDLSTQMHYEDVIMRIQTALGLNK
ncbi:MAG: zinc-dependent metalloprotease [Prevotella sp.]|nr:zinc-dependent metalloprotease [Prevotella sp.]MBR4651311.1 zinc-dependent metalloprotease [Prevotella sp.]